MGTPKVEIGKCYGSDELCELLGIDVGERYGYVGFITDDLVVITRDAGNDCYDVLQIIERG